MASFQFRLDCAGVSLQRLCSLDRITVLSNSSKYSLAVPLSLPLQDHGSFLITYPPSLGRLPSAAYERLPAPVRPQGLPRTGRK